MPLATYKDLCMDAADPIRLGAFWGAVLGWELEEHEDGDADLRDGSGRVQVWLNRVPEPPTVKNRVHVDLLSDDLAAIVARGATVLSAPAENGLEWHVLADPDGNVFCVFDRTGA